MGFFIPDKFAIIMAKEDVRYLEEFSDITYQPSIDTQYLLINF